MSLNSYSRSEQIHELAAALAKAQGAMGPVAKTKTVTVRSDKGPYTYSYADLADLIEIMRKPLADNGLAVLQLPVTNERGSVQLVTTLMHTSGQWVEGVMDTGQATGRPQSVGSALTYFKRYSLQALGLIAAEDDDDAQAVNHAGERPKAQTPQARPREQAPRPRGRETPPPRAQPEAPRQTEPAPAARPEEDTTDPSLSACHAKNIHDWLARVIGNVNDWHRKEMAEAGIPTESCPDFTERNRVIQGIITLAIKDELFAENAVLKENGKRDAEKVAGAAKWLFEKHAEWLDNAWADYVAERVDRAQAETHAAVASAQANGHPAPSRN